MKDFNQKMIVFLFLFASFSSCQKQGCTNEFADNFDQEAEEDDGSCILAREKFLGSFNVSRSCVYENDSTYILEVTAGPNDNEIVMKNLFGWNESLRAQVSGSDISFKDENAGITYEGTGYLAGNQFIVTFKACETFYYPCSDPEECTSTCIKK